MKSIRSIQGLVIVYILSIAVSCNKNNRLSDQQKIFVPSQISLAGCQKLRPLHDLMEHRQISSLFACLGWQQKYPNLLRTIEKQSASQWNSLVAPFHHFLWGTQFQNEEQNIAARKNFQKSWHQISGQVDAAAIAAFLVDLMEQFRIARDTGVTKLKLKDDVREENIKNNYWEQFFLQNNKNNKLLLQIFAFIANVQEENFRRFDAHDLSKIREVMLKPEITDVVKQSFADIAGKISLERKSSKQFLDQVAKVLNFQINEKPWFTLLVEESSEDKKNILLPLIMLETPHKILPEIPKFYHVIKTYLSCSQNEKNKKLYLSPFFQQQLMNSPWMSPQDFYQEIIDLQIKFLGVRELCGIEKLPDTDGEKQLYLELGRLMYDLSDALTDEDALKSLQYFQRSLQTVSEDPFAVLNYFNDETVQKIYQQLSPLLLQFPDMGKYFLTMMTRDDAISWKDQVAFFTDSELWSALEELQDKKLFSATLNFFYRVFITATTNSENFKSIAKFFLLMFPPTLLQEWARLNLDQKSSQDWAKLRKDFLDSPQVVDEFKNLISSNDWWQLLELMTKSLDISPSKISKTKPPLLKISHLKKHPIVTTKQNFASKIALAPEALCLEELNKLKFSDIDDLLKSLPSSCVQLSASMEQHFSWLVLRDFYRLNLWVKPYQAMPHDLFQQWLILDPRGLSLVADLFLVGEFYSNDESLQNSHYVSAGFSGFWQDLEIVFHQDVFKKFLVMGLQKFQAYNNNKDSSHFKMMDSLKDLSLSGDHSGDLIALIPKIAWDSFDMHLNFSEINKILLKFQTKSKEHKSLWELLQDLTRATKGNFVVNALNFLRDSTLEASVQNVVLQNQDGTSRIDQLNMLERFELLFKYSGGVQHGFFSAYFVNKLAEADHAHDFRPELKTMKKLLHTLISYFGLAKKIYGFTDSEYTDLKNIESLFPVLEQIHQLPLGNGKMMNYHEFFYQFFGLLKNASNHKAQNLHWIFGLQTKNASTHQVHIMDDLINNGSLVAVANFIRANFVDQNWLSLIKTIQSFLQWWSDQKIDHYEKSHGDDDLFQLTAENELDWNNMKKVWLDLNQYWLQPRPQAALQRFLLQMQQQSPPWKDLFDSFTENSWNDLVDISLQKNATNPSQLNIEVFWDYYFSHYRQAMIDLASQARKVLSEPVDNK